MRRSKIKALVAGYYGSSNAGDDAILDRMLKELRERVPDFDAVVVSADPAAAAGDYGVTAVSKTDKPGLIAAVRDCDVILLGGGGLLQDYWGMDPGNFLRPGVNASYSAYAALAALFDKPFVLYAVGVGPLATSDGRRYARMMCEQARLITVRDTGSKALLEDVGVNGEHIHVTADPAFGINVPATELHLAPPIIGVAVRNWNMGIDAEAWESELAAALDSFCAGRQGSVLFLPFEKAGAEDDVAAANRIRSRMRFGSHSSMLETAVLETAVLETAADAPSWLAGAIAGCNVVVAMRYHAGLFAIRSGIPVIGLVYDPKVRHLFAAAGAEAYAVELGALRADNLSAMIEQALQDTGLPGRLRSAADDLIKAASRTPDLVAHEISGGFRRTPPLTATRMWLDELTAAAYGVAETGVTEEIKEAIAERRREIGSTPAYDVICFPGIEWNFRWMRAQQLMSQFADRGHRVFFISPAYFLANNGVRFAAHSLRGNVWEVRLATPRAVEVYSGLMADDVRAAIVDDVSALAREFGIGRAVSMLHLATWAPAADDLRARFGWPVVYDCMDDWSGFAWMPEALIDAEVALARHAQLVVTTAQKLWDKWSGLNPQTILVRNAADIEHFQDCAHRGPAPDLPVSRRIVGFFGAIDSWFDVELVLHAATHRPDYFFALLGAVYDAPVERLRELPNVRLFGHQPYDDLPAWLERFDACIIPFKINTVTQATDPVKFYEYLAQGKPVISTRLPELEIYREILYLADGANDFVRLLDAAVSEGNDRKLRDRRLAVAGENTWAARYERIDSAITATLDAGTRAMTGKLLFVCPVLIVGGVEVILKTRATELLRRGFQVRLISMEDAGGQILFEESGIDSRVCSDETEFARELIDFQPDWIVIIDTPAMVPAARRAAPDATIVYEVHSTYPQTLAPLVNREFLDGIRGIIVPSASQERRLRTLLAVEKSIEIVPNALAPLFLEEVGPASKPGRPIVLWVGRLDSLKNWRAFIEISTRLRDLTQADFLLLSAGPCGETDAAEVESAVAGMEGRLHWIREIHPAGMPDIYRSTAQSGGCMVSTSSAESFGVAILEAMACRCPVVVPDIEGLRDLARPGETGWVYPAGDVGAACGQVIQALHELPEQRQQIIGRAYRLAQQFGPEPAAERFLDTLAIWSASPEMRGPVVEPAEEHGLSRERDALAHILAAHSGARKIVIFPASIAWSASSISERPQQWARALAAGDCLVFYCDPQHDAAFTEVEPGAVVANVSLEVYDVVEAPVVIVNSSNLQQLGHFRNPLVIYEYRNAEQKRSALEEEWLARAAVIIVDSEEARQAVAGWRPDALLVSRSERADALRHVLEDQVLEDPALEDPDAWRKDPVRLRAMLSWREQQVKRLETQIRERDRPAVDMLHGAVTEQKRILSERDKGIAFLRQEVASRDRTIAERDSAVEFLRNEVRHRDLMIARQQEQPTALEAEVAAQREALRNREEEIAALRLEIAAREEGIGFLRQEIAAREQTIASGEEGIRFLRQEVAERDKTIAGLLARLPWWHRRQWNRIKGK